MAPADIGSKPGLISRADDDEIRHHVVAEERLRQAERVKEDIVAGARRPIDDLQQAVRLRIFDRGIADHGAGWHFAGADDGRRCAAAGRA